MQLPKEESLRQKMNKLADSGHPRADELRAVAEDFQAKVEEFWHLPETLSIEAGDKAREAFIAACTAARRLYQECSAPDPKIPTTWQK